MQIFKAVTNVYIIRASWLVWVLLISSHALFSMIFICAESVRSVGLPEIAASNCAEVFSSVPVFGLPDLLASATQPVLLNLLISFSRCHGFPAFCVLQ